MRVKPVCERLREDARVQKRIDRADERDMQISDLNVTQTWLLSVVRFQLRFSWYLNLLLAVPQKRDPDLPFRGPASSGVKYHKNLSWNL